VKKQIRKDKLSFEKTLKVYPVLEDICRYEAKMNIPYTIPLHKMTLFGKSLVLLLIVFFFSGSQVFSQSLVTRNNYIGDWESPTSWNPTWIAPLTNVNGTNIIINGYITVNNQLSFTGTSSKLIINDTLVVKGNLSLGDNNDLTINDNGILIIRGSLSIGNQTLIISDGYLVINSDFIKSGSVIQGQFTSNDNPEKVFICGSITPAELTLNNPLFPAINCSAPTAAIFPNSHCSYGNLADLINDPLYSFFQTTCLAPTPTITAGGPLTFCEGGSVTLSSSIGTTYLWSTGGTTSTIGVSTSGSYTVKVTNSSGCLSAVSTAIEVKVNPLPQTPAITALGSTSFCSGGSVTLSAGIASGYLWSTGSASSAITVSSAGSYTVRVTDSNGCQSAVSLPVAVSVNVVAVPTISATGSATICAGDYVTLISSPGTSYLWSDGSTSENIKVNTAGNYSVRITDTNGCQSNASSPVEVKVNPLPVVSAGIDATIPYGTSTLLNATVTGTGPFAFNWTPSGNLLNSSVEDPTTLNLTSTTAFVLKATSSLTSCSNTDEVTITISGGPLNSTPTANPSTICSGTPVQLHSLAGGGSGTYTYTWSSNPAGFTSSAPNPIANPNVTTTYYVAVNDGFNTVNSQVTVTVNPLPPIPVVTPDGPLTFCAGGSVNLTSSGGANYLWSTNANTQSIKVTTSGSYTVQTISLSGCKSIVSSPVLITVNNIPGQPSITADGPTVFCSGGSVNLTSSSGAIYNWSTGETSSVIKVNSTGSYSIQLTNAAGCHSAVSAPIFVTVNNLPPAPTVNAGGPTTFCEGGSVTLTSSSATGNLWSNGATTPYVNITTPGTYTVLVKNSNGCQSPSSTATGITVNSLPAKPVVTASGPLTFCSGGEVNLTSSLGSTYLWSNDATTQSIKVTATDNLVVRVKNAVGCESPPSNEIQVTVNSSPVVVPGPDQCLKFVFETEMEAELSATESGEWSLLSGSAQIADVHSPTTRITGLKIGDNLFLWKVRNNFCETSGEVKISVTDLLIPSVITPNGDGKNDFFRIGDYEGKVELLIINRWGNIEYSNTDYSNEWDGRNSKGSELPADTYFYIVKFVNGKVSKGSVLIKR
jgi:gliding motility-associated-like protein